jgi:hypothetical protein
MIVFVCIIGVVLLAIILGWFFNSRCPKCGKRGLIEEWSPRSPVTYYSVSRCLACGFHKETVETMEI